MPTNIEIKARVSDPDAVRRAAAALGEAQPPVRQHDTFFAAAQGRLKLRRLSPTDGKLIYYERPDAPGPAVSHYNLHRTRDPDGLGAVLSAALGTTGTVRKRRRLVLAGQTRIHLDDVEGLGHFVELEVVLHPGQSPADGTRVAEALMIQLGIKQTDLIDKAYVDLLNEQ